MSLREKTRRRLLLLSAAVFGVTTIAGTGAAVRLVYLRRAAQTGRTEGLAAMARSDYPTALKQLGRYLSRYPDDANVLLSYAKARELVDESDHSNLGQAISLYRRVLELKPGQPEAQRRLLDLYVEVGFNTEAITVADKILTQADPNSSTFNDDCTHALRSKTVALLRMQRLDEAQKNVQRLAQLSPLDLEVRILELQIMLRKGDPRKVMQYANSLVAEHPNDDRFELLKSVAATLTGDDKTAAAIVKPLASRPQIDATYTRLLVAQLDRVQLFDESFTCLQQAAKNSTDPQVRRLWIRRLFETSQFSTLIDQTAGLDPTAASSDVEELAMRVLALSRSEHRKEATDVIDALEKRGQTESAAAKWAAALRAIALHDSSDPLKSVTAVHDALLVSQNNPILLEELGDAYAEAGSRDKAMGAWRSVTRVAPEWSAPLEHISQSLLSAGRASEALDAANAAELRSPHDHDALASVAVASAAALPDGPSPNTDKVLTLIDEINRQFPKETDLWPLKVNVLARAQRHDAAIDALRAALASNPLPSERTLLSLAQVSQSFGLNMEDACWSASEKAYGLTPQLAFARASWMRDHQHGADALALLEKNQAKHPDDIAWKSVWAEYLDQSDDPRAKAEWIALGDGNPKDVQLQWRAVSARSIQNDHDFVGRTIDRLVALIGDDSLSLHMLRARWYLRGSGGDSDASQAAVLLGEVSRSAPDMLAPRLLLATCYMRLGNITGAIDQLVAASDAQPELASLSIEVARVLHAHGEFTRSRQYIDRACRSNQATLPVLRQAASLLALQGDYKAGLVVLEKAYKDQKQLPADLVLASLYRQANQPDKTAEICKRLMDKPDAQSVAFTADFYASQGHPGQATAALALLDGLKLPPGNKEAILARYNARYGSPDDAAKDFLAAARAATVKPEVAWQQMISFCFGSGRIDQAIAAADEAGQKLPNASGFAVVTRNAALIKDAQNLDGIRPLLMTLGTDAAVNTPVLEAIGDVVAASRHTEASDQTALKLRQLADRNPRILSLQTITLEFYMNCGEVDEAARLAARTALAFPTAAEPLRLENAVMGAEHHWDEALDAAREWRRHDPGEAMDADLAIAIAEVHLGDVSGANQQIQPYLDRAVQDPDKFSGVMLIRAVGLLANHQPKQVEDLLVPFLAKSSHIRSVWLSLATNNLDDPVRAQAWLDQVSPLVSNNPAEQSELALAEILLGKKDSNPDDVKKGTSRLSAVVQAPDAPAKSLISWGMLCEETGDLDGAKTAYHRIIDRVPTDAVAKDDLREQAIASNNLAAVLVKTNGDLGQAQQLANRALSIYPKYPAFLDTLATVQDARKDYDDATSTMKQAKSLDPLNFKWRVNLLKIMVDAGQTPAAKTELQLTHRDFPSLATLSPQLRQQFDLLSAKIQ
jgi:tetratricopeptide (TPR) repeat protein